MSGDGSSGGCGSWRREVGAVGKGSSREEGGGKGGGGSVWREHPASGAKWGLEGCHLGRRFLGRVGGAYVGEGRSQMQGKWYLERPWRGRGRWRGRRGVVSDGAGGARVCGPGVFGSSFTPRFSLLSHQEERVLSGALEASKALLEEQLEAAQERCARLHETQRENLLLRTRLGEAHAVIARATPVLQ